jgi:uncharacterized cupin superfamily protein
MNSGNSAAGTWDLAPIDPSWIEDGSPIARVQPLASGELSSGFWDCTAGRFVWHYGAAESIYILEGYAIVRDRAGYAWHHLGPGDSITFPAGSSYDWFVSLYVRKFWVIGPKPSLLRRLIRRVRAAK